MWIYSWNFNSHSARALAQAMGARLILHEGSRFVGGPRKPVINWGCSTLPTQVIRSTVLNSAPRVAFMTNKLRFFQLCKKTWRQPPFTTDQDKAISWLKEGRDVVARTALSGHSGVGIVLLHPGDELVYAPLYTQYVPKMSEFRVHCVGRDIIDVQRKAARRDFRGDTNWQIRNHDNGFVYIRGDVCPQDVRYQALKCFLKTGLDFGAVDVIYNMERQRAYVLEINTAPGLEGTTVGLYAHALRGRIDEMLHM